MPELEHSKLLTKWVSDRKWGSPPHRREGGVPTETRGQWLAARRRGRRDDGDCVRPAVVEEPEGTADDVDEPVPECRPGGSLVVLGGLAGLCRRGNRESEGKEQGEGGDGPFHGVCLLRWFPSREKARSDIRP